MNRAHRTQTTQASGGGPAPGHRRPRRGWTRSVSLTISTTAIVAALTGCGLIEEVFRGSETGPDGDDLGEDPLLHIQLEGAAAGELRTKTGTEGGVWDTGPSESRAFRTWTIDQDEAQDQLLTAVRAALDLDTTFATLRCSDSDVGDDISYNGSKEVEADGETIAATVRIGLDIESRHTEPSRSDLTISLSSDGTGETTEPAQSSPRRDPVTGDCPQELIDLLPHP